MRLQANEEDVYRLMDTKERYFWMIGIGSLLEGIAAYFLYFRIKCWDLLYLCVILAFGIILLLRQAVKISRKIMEQKFAIWSWTYTVWRSASRRKTDIMNAVGYFTMK